MDKKEQRRLLSDWLFESLISVQSSCLAQESKQRWLLPRRSFFFFCSRPNFSRRTRAEMLATQAKKNWANRRSNIFKHEKDLSIQRNNQLLKKKLKLLLAS